ncbi:hypothetical protein KM043_013726 [Ampulex compressa]|nr:hypothetical protein KM043_013726 [Ampulex compressa]
MALFGAASGQDRNDYTTCSTFLAQVVATSTWRQASRSANRAIPAHYTLSERDRTEHGGPEATATCGLLFPRNCGSLDVRTRGGRLEKVLAKPRARPSVEKTAEVCEVEGRGKAEGREAKRKRTIDREKGGQGVREAEAEPEEMTERDAL